MGYTLDPNSQGVGCWAVESIIVFCGVGKKILWMYFYYYVDYEILWEESTAPTCVGPRGEKIWIDSAGGGVDYRLVIYT